MKLACLLMLSALSISGIVYAQENTHPTNAEKILGIPFFSINRTYQIDLAKGNRLFIDLSYSEALGALGNIDSLLQVFQLDMAPLRDSISDPLSSKRIDYIIDNTGNKKIRIRQSRSISENFILNEGSLSALKMEQDTILIFGMIRNPEPAGGKQTYRYYRLRFFLNQAIELSDYIDGRLNKKIKEIQASDHSSWQTLFNGSLRLKTDSSITARQSGGPHFRQGSYINAYFSANLQTYKSYLVPSLSLGVAVRLNNGLTTHDIGLYWEPQFLFLPNPSHNSLVTYQNDFITLSYKLGYAPNHRPAMEFITFRPFVSLGWLYQQRGPFYDNHSFRLGIGNLSLLKGGASIQPVLYFHDFFRGVTPGLKLVVKL